MVETLAVAAHGGAVVLHALGIVYNIRKGNKLDVIIHSLALIYDANAVRIHARRLNEQTREMVSEV